MEIKMDLPEPTFCSISLHISWIPSVPTGNTPGAPQCHSSLFLFHRNNHPVWTAIASQSSFLLPAEPDTHAAIKEEFMVTETDFSVQYKKQMLCQYLAFDLSIKYNYSIYFTFSKIE